MKVCHFNTFPYGGAATAARRMHQQLNRTGVESQFCFHRDDKDTFTDSSFCEISFKTPEFSPLFGAIQKRKHRLRQKQVYRQYNEHLATRPSGVETFSMAELPNPTKLQWHQLNADVAHFHWISFFADYPSFFESIPNDVPLVWTLHDMNAFTGGCHYSNDCHGFRFGCGNCPQVTNASPRDVSHHSFQVKKRCLVGHKVAVVSPSNWLLDLARQSDVWPDTATFELIRLGFDLDVFKPRQKIEARQRLGIESDAILIGFGAEDIQNRRKGIHHLMAALRNLNADNNLNVDVECLIFGSGQIANTDDLPKLHQLGYLQSEATQADFYNAADMIVVPSREDNQPQVGLEAMACGTPVVGFSTGGIPEYVRQEQTGLLAELGNEEELASCLSRLVKDPHLRQRLGQQARAMMENEFDIVKQTAQYQQLYSRILPLRARKAA